MVVVRGFEPASPTRKGAHDLDDLARSLSFCWGI